MQMFILFMLCVGIAVYGSKLAELLQRLFGFLDRLDSGLKRIFVAALVYGLSVAVYKLFNMTNLLDVKGIASEQLTSIMSVGLSYVFHNSDKIKAISER